MNVRGPNDVQSTAVFVELEEVALFVNSLPVLVRFAFFEAHKLFT